MKKFYIALFLFTGIPGISYASDVVVFDTATFRIKNYMQSVHTPYYKDRADAVVNPDISQVNGVPKQYWKWDPQKKCAVEMSDAEKAEIDAPGIAEQKEINEVAYLKSVLISGTTIWGDNTLAEQKAKLSALIRYIGLRGVR